ncbi:MAG: hypothetical protein Q4F43_01900 [Eubacteriales bacterium]|nr:hypothetical protein [Eubacteriales bacterium]
MSKEFKKLTIEELEKLSGGAVGKAGLFNDGDWKVVAGLVTGYLALRSAPCYDSSNEIGQLHNDDYVQICGNDTIVDHDFDKGGPTSYSFVYSPRLYMTGYVNSRFLRG